jgi:hypothetical protein
MTRRALAFGAVMLLGLAGPAAAEERSTVAAVREHDARAQRLFEAGDFEGALDALRAAQQLRPASQRLFSMAVCQQRLGVPREAIRLYRTYADAADADDEHRELARRRIGEIRAELDAAAETDGGGAPTIFDDGGEEPASERARSTGRRRLSRTPFYAMLGLTGAAALGVAVLGGLTLDLHDQFVSSRNPTVRFDLRSTGWPMAVATDVLLGVACVSAAVAVVLAILTDWRRRPASAARLSRLALAPHGAEP